MLETISKQDLAKALHLMATYYEDCVDNNDPSCEGYFSEIIASGLFHDAVGKIVEEDSDKVVVTTEY